MIELGFVGCGDVATRTYFPALAPLADRAKVAACFDPRVECADAAAARFPGAIAYTRYEDLLSHAGLDAIVNLTPAPVHREITSQALAAGLHVYTEKPLAATLPDAQSLIEQADQAGLLLLCAPAVMAARRFRWLRELLDAGQFGRLTLATGQMANMGPASWRGYTGDPSVFYQQGVGPVLDTGVYILHAITGLLGPVKRVQAFGGIAIPQRAV
ncbi:MAG: Gfo/Idh/MocA family oxidoreductase, partial [Chloroflexota bacterium]|nr:Gfo/Idh/MocA family oxidoreductase [Chloroflexota bacterium]